MCYIFKCFRYSKKSYHSFWNPRWNVQKQKTSQGDIFIVIINSYFPLVFIIFRNSDVVTCGCKQNVSDLLLLSWNPEITEKTRSWQIKLLLLFKFFIKYN